MENLKLNTQTQYGRKGKASLMTCFLSILLVFIFIVNTTPGTAFAAGGSVGTLYVDSLCPLQQELRLSNPTAAAPGGRGFMIPQKVVAIAPSGGPLIGIPITFEVLPNPIITVVMRGDYKSKITVYTDSSGIATAASTYPQFLGEGFQVYSNYSAIKQTLQVKASAPGMNSITFDVIVKTYNYPY